MIGWIAAAALAEPQCSFAVDGRAVTELACAAGGAWTVRCALPDGGAGKPRVRVVAPALAIAAEARVPLASRGSIEIPLAGPGGRAGGFLVDRAGAGLLPGQAVGPNAWCPGVAPATADPVVVTVEVTLHRQTGFAEEPLDGGVVNRVPVYDAGTRYASASAPVIQRPRPQGDIPVLQGPVELPPDDEVRGLLQIPGPDGRWRSFGWTGARRDLPVGTGVVSALVVDLVAPEVGQVTGADPVSFVQRDLDAWLSGDPSSLVGAAGWSRSNVEPPVSVTFARVQRADRSWLRAADATHDVRIGLFGDRLRVVIAHRASPLDADALAAIDEAATWDLP